MTDRTIGDFISTFLVSKERKGYNTICDQVMGTKLYLPHNAEHLTLFNTDPSFREKVFGDDHVFNSWKDPDPLRAFLRKIDDLRAAGKEQSYDEPRYIYDPTTGEEIPKSIELDVDMEMMPDVDDSPIPQDRLSNLVQRVCNELTKYIENNKIYVAVMAKKVAKKGDSPTHGIFKKVGFHIRIFVRVKNDFYEFFCNRLRVDGIIDKFIKDIVGPKIIDPTKPVLDTQTAYIPFLVYGCTSANSHRSGVDSARNYHRLRGLYLYTKDMNFGTEVTKISEFKDDIDGKLEQKYRNTIEFSSYIDGVYVTKPLAIIRDDAALTTQIALFAKKRGTVDPVDVQFVQQDVDDLIKDSPDAKFIYECLCMLKPIHCEERDRRFKILVAIAMHNKEYKCLATRWYMSFPHKWEDGGEGKLDNAWNWARNKRRPTDPEIDRLIGDDIKACNIGMIYKLAKVDDPMRFRDANRQTLSFSIVKAIAGASKKCSRLNDKEIARMVMLLTRDRIKSVNEGTNTTWYEFIDELETQYGSSYKWVKRRKLVTNTVYKLISTDIPNEMIKVKENYVRNLKSLAPGDEARKWLDYAIDKLDATVDMIGNKREVANIAGMLSYETDDDRFGQEMDLEENVLGVKNGVLRFTPQGPVLLQCMHSHKISRTTAAEYRPPEVPITLENVANHPDFYIRSVWSHLSNLFPPNEQDAFIKIMHIFASELDGQKRSPIMLILYSSGSSGKTTMFKYHDNMFGPVDGDGYAARLDVSFYRANKVDNKGSGAPDMEKMKLQFARSASSSEINVDFELDPAKINNITSEKQSGRKIFSDNQSFRATTTHKLCVNNHPILKEKKYGIRRRMLFYGLKYTLVDHPNGDWEKEMDERIEKEYCESQPYLNAYLSIMVFFRQSLVNNYDNKFSNIKSPTLERETAKYIAGQDKTEEFILNKVYKIEGKSVGLEALANAYREWHPKNSRVTTPTVGEVQDSLKESSLKKLVKVGADGKHYVAGISLEPPTVETPIESGYDDEKVEEKKEPEPKIEEKKEPEPTPALIIEDPDDPNW